MTCISQNAALSLPPMAFLRAEKKQSGTYLRIVQSYKDNGLARHKTLHSLGKLEDYPVDQLEAIAKKLLSLAGVALEDIIANSFKEVGRYNYGYAFVIKKLWSIYKMNAFVKQVNQSRKLSIDWEGALQLMVAERLNDPCSKHQSYFNQEEYLGWESRQLHHFYRSLDVLAEHQEALKEHLFRQHRDLFSQSLDVVFYDVTTLYFDSQVEEEGTLRQKGYSKDGKSHKTQVVLGLLVDKFRNPVSYQVYQGNTYEGKTLQDAIKDLKAKYPIERVIVVADSSMIDQANRDYIEATETMDYIIGDSIKNLPKKIQISLLESKNHKGIIRDESTKEVTFSYTSIDYKGRKIFCTYSVKRARKDAHNREKLIKKAKEIIENPTEYTKRKKKGASRFIQTQSKDQNLSLDLEKIEKDKKFDGFKAIATSTDLKAEEVLEKYHDLYKIEQAFRTLKSQLEIRPMFHWTDQRIEGHIAMCFIAFTFLNYLGNLTKLSERQLVKAMDSMQMSAIEEDASDELVYMRSKTTENQELIAKKLKLVVPKDIIPQRIVNHMFR